MWELGECEHSSGGCVTKSPHVQNLKHSLSTFQNTM